MRTLLFQASMPPAYWAESLRTGTHLFNLHPTKTLQNCTPHQALLGTPPTYDHLRVFGCRCYPNLFATMPNKLAPRSMECVLLGFPDNHKGYRCLDLSFNRVIISHHVVFDEQQFPFSRDSPAPLSAYDFLDDTDVDQVIHGALPVGPFGSAGPPVVSSGAGPAASSTTHGSLAPQPAKLPGHGTTSSQPRQGLESGAASPAGGCPNISLRLRESTHDDSNLVLHHQRLQQCLQLLQPQSLHQLHQCYQLRLPAPPPVSSLLLCAHQTRLLCMFLPLPTSTQCKPGQVWHQPTTTTLQPVHSFHKHQPTSQDIS